MKKIITVFVFGICQVLFSQQEHEFGKLTASEKSFAQYEKDTTANAIYLYEKGANSFELKGNYIRLITKYHAKIKILKKSGFEHATIRIPYYHNDSGKEIVSKIRALTHNGSVKISVAKGQVFDVDNSERWSAKKFTFPEVKVGSVLEYTYEIESPFHFNLTGWEFQSDIPKIYTEYYAEIPGNWRYNRSLVGALKLDVNESTIKRKCFDLPMASDPADCEKLRYAMHNVPAFKRSEAFMLSEKNYRSKLEFELAEYNGFRGGKKKYTKTWADVDKEFKSNKDIGRQLRKKNFFEKNVPMELLSGENSLEKAKNIYAFVQDHFTWNRKYGLWHDNRVRKAFDEQRGNIAEINITLINLLNAAGIPTEMMLLSTRDNGLPKTSHPIITDFNYIVAKTKINDQEYLLDATDKMMAFGMLPFRCLNYYGRVMDFEKESYWQSIEPERINSKSIRAQISFNLDQGTAIGGFNNVSLGYESVAERRKMKKFDEEAYVTQIEESFGDDLYITSHEVSEEFSDDKKLTQQFEFEIENVQQDGAIYMDPFLTKFFGKSPFIAEERNYPIDFGYPRRYIYSLSIEIPEGYQVKNLPKKVGIGLPENSGSLQFDCIENMGRINVFFKMNINAIQINSKGYKMMKGFFEKAVDIQNKSFIVLEKA